MEISKMETTRTDLKSKRRYTKPVITVIRLTPEEAILGNCKTSGQSGPGGTGCTAGTCSSEGS
jgi:hypothetical protein